MSTLLKTVHSPGFPVELSAAEVATLRALHEHIPVWNWACVLYPACWASAAVLMQRFPAWPVRAAGIIAIGISIQAMAILMHEALHGSLFRNGKWNRWAAFALGVPAFFSAAAYKAIHLNHHRHTRTAKDQDEIGNSCRTRAQFRAWLYLRYVAGTFLYFFFVPLKALESAAPAVRKRIVAEYLAMLSIYVVVTITCVSLGHVSWLLWYWLLPLNVAMVFSNVRGNAEHVGTGAGSALLISRTVTSSQLVSFLMCNLNYHLEHHLFPGVPWYNLPKVHHLLRPVYANGGAHVERSYVRHTILALSGAIALTSGPTPPSWMMWSQDATDGAGAGAGAGGRRSAFRT